MIRRLSSNWSPDSFWISFQVQTFWQWFDYLCQQAHHDGKAGQHWWDIHPSLCTKFQGICDQKNKLGRPPARFISRSLKRGTATHVAAISQLPQVQALLPQFVLLNKRTFKANDIPGSLPQGLKFIRDVSGWNTAEKMVLILEHIAKIPHFIYKRSSNNSFARCCSITTTVTSYAYFY